MGLPLDVISDRAISVPRAALLPRTAAAPRRGGGALSAGTRNMDHCHTRKRSLDVEVPPFYVRVRVIGNRSTGLRQRSTSCVEAALPLLLVRLPAPGFRNR
jgi:hypothetical protein